MVLEERCMYSNLPCHGAVPSFCCALVGGQREDGEPLLGTPASKQEVESS